MTKDTSLGFKYSNIVCMLAIVYLLESTHLAVINATFGMMVKAVQYILLLCMMWLFIREETTKSQLWLRIVVMGIMAMSVVMSRTFPLFKYFLVMMVGIQCDRRGIYKKLLYIYAIGVCMIFFLGFLGILPSHHARRGYISYGFTHPNMFAAYVLATLCCYIIVYWNRTCVHLCGVVLAAALLTKVLTDSRTSMLVMLVLALVVLICKTKPQILHGVKPIYYLIIALPFLLLVLSWFLAAYYGKGTPLGIAVNSLLNNRPMLGSKVIAQIPLTLFGTKTTGHLVENIYLVCLYNYGIVPTFVQLTVMGYALKSSMDRRSYGEFVCLLIFVVHGMMEIVALSPFMNVAMLSAFVQKSQCNTENHDLA